MKWTSPIDPRIYPAQLAYMLRVRACARARNYQTVTTIKLYNFSINQ